MFLSFAVAYLGATLAVLNPRLSDEERLLRKVELENASNQNNITILTEEHIQRMIIDSLGIGIMELAHEPNGQIPVNPRTMEILSYAEKKEREFDPDHIGSSCSPRALLAPRRQRSFPGVRSTVQRWRRPRRSANQAKVYGSSFYPCVISVGSKLWCVRS